MTKSELIKKIEEICEVENCDVSNAIDIVMEKNSITNTELIALFCKGKNNIDDGINAMNNVPRKMIIV